MSGRVRVMMATTIEGHREPAKVVATWDDESHVWRNYWVGHPATGAPGWAFGLGDLKGLSHMLACPPAHMRLWIETET